MSGIYIPDMEIPISCGYCPLRYVSRDGDECYLGVSFTEYQKRPDDCPLIFLPDLCDLIDRKKLYEKTAEWEAQALHMVAVHMNDEDTSEWKKWCTVLTERSAFKFDVADAPTVIPAINEEIG